MIQTVDKNHKIIYWLYKKFLMKIIEWNNIYYSFLMLYFLKNFEYNYLQYKILKFMNI